MRKGEVKNEENARKYEEMKGKYMLGKYKEM